MKNDVLFLINPYSAEGKSTQLWNHHARGLIKSYPLVDITRIDNLSQFILQKTPHMLGIIGGDGTINSVSEAVLHMPKKKRPVLAVIPCGFGNALSYCLGVETIKQALEVIKNPKQTLTIDILQTNLPDKSVGVFNISVGFDARIVYTRMNDRYIGFRSYILSGIKSFFLHPHKMLTVTVDDIFTFRAVASSLVVANCPVIGQQFVIASDARLNDGLLDCTLFSTKYAFLTNLRFKGFKHPLYSQGGKVFFKAKRLHIAGDPFVQIDGDPFVRHEGVRIEILPHALTFLRNSLDTTSLPYQPFIL